MTGSKRLEGMYLFNTVKEKSSICNKARLDIKSQIRASAWLWAIPNKNVGLFMTSHEFIVALKLWLGVTIFFAKPTLW